MRTIPAILGCLGVAACSGRVPGECGRDPSPAVVLVNEVAIARPADGTSNGFDLDGLVSVQGGETGCGVGDFTRWDGTPGIDNGLAGILPALDLTEAVALDELVQLSVDRGDLLLMLELRDLDGLDDDCVDVTVFRGQGTPTIGSHGVIEPSQTFDVDPAVQPIHVAGLALDGGALTVEGLDLPVVLSIFGETLHTTLEHTAIHLVLRDDGDFTGQLGGALDYAEVVDLAKRAEVDPDLLEALPALFAHAADLAPDADGTCQRLSVAFDIKGVEAYLYDDTTPLY